MHYVLDARDKDVNKKLPIMLLSNSYLVGETDNKPHSYAYVLLQTVMNIQKPNIK